MVRDLLASQAAAEEIPQYSSEVHVHRRVEHEVHAEVNRLQRSVSRTLH